MVRREEIRAMQDAWRAYLDLALGLTETSRKKATKVVKKLTGRGGATAEQLQSMAEELVSTSLANREALTRMVRYELERALGRVGLATTEEVSALTARVHELEQELAEARATTPVATSASDTGPAGDVLPVVEAAPPVRKVARRTVAKKAAPVPVDSTPVVPAPIAPLEPMVTDVSGPAAPAKKAPAKKAPAEKAVAKKAVAKAPAKAAVPARKAVAKKVPAKKAPAKKATGRAEQP
jgi:polyhydroxyalkanoate synthesis regulator phasin